MGSGASGVRRVGGDYLSTKPFVGGGFGDVPDDDAQAAAGAPALVLKV